jgi:hypothetical protein
MAADTIEETMPMSRASREWVTFADPKEDGRTWQLDVTFLLSSWQCIFGAGCQGVLDEKTPELAQGCCSYGAYFADVADRDHVVRIAAELTDDEWQFAAAGRSKGIYKKMGRDDEGNREWHTRLVRDGCIFLNRVEFPAGPGCALHLHAMNTGLHHSEVKPEICWQLPLRRVDEDKEDGTVVSTLTEFGRAGWGEGGDDFAWWCTEAPEAFIGKEPVYRSLEPELRKTLGKKLHKQVVEYLDARFEASSFPPVVHPAAVPVEITRKSRSTR